MLKSGIKRTKSLVSYSNLFTLIFCVLIVLASVIIVISHGISKEASVHKEAFYEVRSCADRIDFVLVFIFDESENFYHKMHSLPVGSRRNDALKFLDENFFSQGILSFSPDGILKESYYKKGISEPDKEECDELTLLAKNSQKNYVTRLFKNKKGAEYFYLGISPDYNKSGSFFVRYDAKIITNILRSSFGYFYIISPSEGIVASNFKMDEIKLREFNYFDFVSSNSGIPRAKSYFVDDSYAYRSVIRMMNSFVVYEVPHTGFFFLNPVSICVILFASLMIAFVFIIRRKFYRHVILSSSDILDACSRSYRGLPVKYDPDIVSEYSSLFSFFQKISAKIKEKEEIIEICREENYELFFAMNIAVIEESFDLISDKESITDFSNEDIASIFPKINILRANQKALDLFSSIGFPDFKNCYDVFKRSEGLGLYRKICTSANFYDKVIDFTCSNGNKKKAVFHISKHNMRGNMKRLLISAIDITDSIRQNEEIKDNFLMWNYIADSVDTPLAIINSLGQIIKLNQFAYAFFKLSELTEDKKTIDDVFQIINKDGINISNRIRAAMLLGKPVNYSETSYVCVNALKIPVSFSVVPYKDSMDRTAGSIVVFCDLSNQAKIKSDIRRFENVQILYDTMGGVVNDFNNILASLSVKISTAKMIAEDGSSFSESLSDSEILVNKAKDVMMNVFRMLKPLNTGASCDLAVVLLKTAGIFETRAKQLIVGEIPDFSILMDEESTAKILYEAASFVIDRALPNREIHVEAERKIGDKMDSAFVDVIFSGISLTDEEFSAFSEMGIFIGDKYSEIRALRDYEDSMTGSNVKFKAEKTGESFSLRISFPAKIYEENIVDSEVNHDIDERKAKILVMDDDDILRKTLKRMLEYMGHSVVTVTEGSEAVQLYRLAQIDGKPFDITILDLNVKRGMGGEEAAAEIKMTNQTAQIIASSGYIDKSESDFGKGNFCAFLSKPFMSKQIAAVINKVLRVSLKT